MSLLPLFQSFYQSGIGIAIRDSTWLFPVIKVFHLLGFGLTAGAVLVANLPFLGVGLSRQPAAQVYAAAQPYLIGGLTVMFLSGIPLFLSESIKCYYSFAFWVKMTSLFLVLLFTFTVQRHVTQRGLTSDRPLLGRLTALISLGLWSAVAWSGRWIGVS
jgi:hypothetical protein